MNPTTILLADDHPAMCAALREMLQTDYNVIGSAKDGRTLVEMALDLKPDLVVLDLGLPLLNGLAAARQLKAQLPGVKLVFLTMNRDPEIACEAFRIGASGFVPKNLMGEELLPVIKNALKTN